MVSTLNPNFGSTVKELTVTGPNPQATSALAAQVHRGTQKTILEGTFMLSGPGPPQPPPPPVHGPCPCWCGLYGDGDGGSYSFYGTDDEDDDGNDGSDDVEHWA